MVNKFVVEENSPLWFTAFRWVLSALLLGIVFLRRSIRTPRTSWLRGSILGAFLYAGFALQTVGIQTTTASKSAFFTGMLVVFTPIVYAAAQRLFNIPRKPLRVGNLAGVALAVTGLYMMTTPSGSHFSFGDGLTLGCAFCFALYIVALDLFSDEPDKMQLAFAQFVFCAVASVITATVGEELRVAFDAEYVGAVLYLTIFANIVAMSVQIRYQGETTPTRAGVIFSLEPVIAAVFAFVVRGELLGWIGVSGAGIIIIGLLASEFSAHLPVLSIAVSGKPQDGLE